jgi:hypothetical protein
MKWLKTLLDLVPFNQGNRKVQLGVLVVIALLVAASATRCAHAGDGDYAQFGIGSTIVRGPAPVVDYSLVYQDAAPKDAWLEVGATFIGESNFEGAYQRNNFALRAAILDGFGRFDVGLGAAFLQNVDTYNGSHVNFTLILQYRVKSLPFNFRVQHFSNGGTQSPNKGRDMLMVMWRFE